MWLQLYRISSSLESKLHLLDAIRILQSKQNFVEWDSDESGVKFSISFDKSIKQDYDKILANLHLRKSAYFDYLSQSQIKGKILFHAQNF